VARARIGYAAMLEQFAIHATVAASDLERARAWYAAKLGLEPAMEDPGGLWYRFGDGTWLSVYRTEFAGTARNTQAGWTVTGIEAVMAGLRARGVTFEEYDLGDGMATVDGLLSMGPTRLAGSRTRRATPSRSARSTARSDLPRPIGGRRAGRRRPRATPAHRGSR